MKKNVLRKSRELEIVIVGRSRDGDGEKGRMHFVLCWIWICRAGFVRRYFICTYTVRRLRRLEAAIPQISEAGSAGTEQSTQI